MSKVKILVFLAVFGVFQYRVYSQPAGLVDFIEHYSDSMITTALQPGMIISITRGDEVIYEKAKGIANISTDELMNEKMRFRIGSLTKTFTAT
ncbi:MAG: serine hydrolase, partial [Ignavibacteria bacterium]|nr:serine hydrolase [Ignavibacteria bacterium]